MSRRLLVPFIIWGLPVVILAGAWRLSGVSAIEDDLIYYLPIRQYIGECVRSGHFPFWNPWAAMGTSIAADPQAGLWYPPTYLFALLPPTVAYPVTLCLHFALAGTGMYRFLRSQRLDWRAALLGAIAFEFSGFLVAHRAHLTILEAAAWLPWLFYTWRRFVHTGNFKYVFLASILFGLHALVQHIQISIIGITLLTAYMALILLPQRHSLLGAYPAGMALGAMLAAIQVLPTWLNVGGSIRGAPAYHLFIENPWWPSSVLMLLFPMFFGARTPNLWAQPWWGPSHFCEQSAYPTILIVILAGASLWLIRKDRTRMENPAPGSENRTILRREVLFWWLACGVSLLIALGDLTPLSKIFFHVPVYNQLRVPARWILVWSLAMPVLASITLSMILRGGYEAERLTRGIRVMAMKLVPAVAGVFLLFMVIIFRHVDNLAASYSSWLLDPIWAGVRVAVRPSNPAILWPLFLIAVTGWSIIRWSSHRRPTMLTILFVIFIIDMASVASFVDVDTHIYRPTDLRSPPPLAQAIRDFHPKPGDRLLVPRFSACYDRPVEMLWPQTNIQHRIATFQGYGPFLPIANRLLLKFMPWGSSEEILSLLRNPGLCRTLGIRFIAIRSEQERALLRDAMEPTDDRSRIQSIVPTMAELQIIRHGQDVLWPVQIATPGIYQLDFDVEPVPGSTSRGFIRIETSDGQGIGDSHSVEPVDLSAGRRRMRILFPCRMAVGRAFIRIKSEMGEAFYAGLAAFGRIAGIVKHAPSEMTKPFVFRAQLPGEVLLYELEGTADFAFWAERIKVVPGIIDAVDILQTQAEIIGLPGCAVIENSGHEEIPPAGGAGTISWQLMGNAVAIDVQCRKHGLMVINQSYDTGWKASLDGRPIPVYRVNAVQQGIKIPTGSHHIELRYRPLALVTGALCTVIGLIVIMMGYIVTRTQWCRNIPARGNPAWDAEHGSK